MTTQQSQSTSSHRNQQWKSKLKTHGGGYRKKLRIDREAIKASYKENGNLELGSYRHNSKFINYDFIVTKALDKWQPRDERMALEIIHSIQNKANALILECILEADREIR